MGPARPPIDDAALAREVAAIEAALGEAGVRNAADAAGLEETREDLARIGRDLRAYAERRRSRVSAAAPATAEPAAAGKPDEPS